MSSIKKRKDGCYIYQIYYIDSNTKLRRRYQKNFGKLENLGDMREFQLELFKQKFEAVLDLQGGLPLAQPLSAAIKLYLAIREEEVAQETRSSNTLRTDRSSLNIFLDFVRAKFGDRKIDKIYTAHIQAWIDARHAEAKSQTTINVNLRTVKSFFSHQLDKGEISEHPFKGITISETELNKDDSVIGFFDQIRQFILKELTKRERGLRKPRTNQRNNKKAGLDWFDDNNWFIHYVWVMLNTGMRSGEILNLKWKVDDEDKGALTSRSFSYLSADETTIDIYFKKRKRTIPVTDNLKRSLTMLHQHNQDNDIETKYLFENPRTYKPHTTSAAANLFKKLVIALELDEKHTLHSLRHGYISKLVINGGDIIRISKAVGHSSSEFTQKRYMHLRAKEDLTSTMNLISQED